MTLQDTPRIRSILEMEHQLGEGDWDAAGEHFTPDVQYHVGAQPPRHGIDGERIANWRVYADLSAFHA